MKKTTLVIVILLTTLMVNAQVLLVRENFQDWAVQATAGSYTKTKMLADGTTNGTFTSSSLIVDPVASIGSAGTAVGNGNPSVGRVQIAGTTSALELPQLPSIGVVNIKMNPGTSPNGYKLQVYDGVTPWADIAGTTTAGDKNIIKLFTYNLTYASPTKIRIVANQGGSVSLWDVEVYSYPGGTTLTSPTNANATSVTANGFTANWNSVNNAVGYDVNVYLGTNLVNTTYVSGSTSTNAPITGLSAGFVYTFNVVAKGGLTTYFNSIASVSSSTFTTLDPYAANTINTNFSDGTWGTIIPTPTANLPATGSFPSSTVNGFELVKSVFYGSISTDPRGVIRTNVARIDKNTYGGMLTFPTVNSLEQLEIHVIGSDTKTFLLKAYNPATFAWESAGSGTYTITGSNENIFLINISKSVPTKFRIENNTTSSLNVVQVITRTTALTALTAPTILQASNVIGGGFTANWTPVDANATGYRVTVLNYAKYLNKSFIITGQTSNSLAINGLDSAAICTYQVSSLGDATHLDSYLSTTSTPSILLKLGVPTMGVASSITTNGFTANWTPVLSATNYDVLVYQGLNLINTTNVLGQATSSLVIIGLQSNTTYTYKVIAKNGIVAFNSDLSNSSADITTTVTGFSNIESNDFIKLIDKTIMSSETGNFEIFNLRGIKMLDVKATNKVNINLAKGLYIVKFSAKDGKQIIQKINI